MIETKNCDIWVSHNNPCEISCHKCAKTFATLELPMTAEVLESVCNAYKERCENGYDNL